MKATKLVTQSFAILIIASGCLRPDFLDQDDDNINDDVDNCPRVYNPAQEDLNGNGIGDACEVTVSVSPTYESTKVGAVAWQEDFTWEIFFGCGLQGSEVCEQGFDQDALSPKEVTFISLVTTVGPYKWGGDCDGNISCIVNLESDRVVSAIPYSPSENPMGSNDMYLWDELGIQYWLANDAQGNVARSGYLEVYPTAQPNTIVTALGHDYFRPNEQYPENPIKSTELVLDSDGQNHLILIASHHVNDDDQKFRVQTQILSPNNPTLVNEVQISWDSVNQEKIVTLDFVQNQALVEVYDKSDWSNIILEQSETIPLTTELDGLGRIAKAMAVGGIAEVDVDFTFWNSTPLSGSNLGLVYTERVQVSFGDEEFDYHNNQLDIGFTSTGETIHCDFNEWDFDDRSFFYTTNYPEVGCQ